MGDRENVKLSSSVVESPSSCKQIVQVHSAITPKMIPSKFDQNFNTPRPVLHKYTPEQVEIVYHRRTGTDEVVQLNKSTQKKKKKSSKSSSVGEGEPAASKSEEVTKSEAAIKSEEVTKSEAAIKSEEVTKSEAAIKSEEVTKPVAAIKSEAAVSVELPVSIETCIVSTVNECKKDRMIVEPVVKTDFAAAHYEERLMSKQIAECSEESPVNPVTDSLSAKILEESTVRLNQYATVVTKLTEIISQLDNRIEKLETVTQAMSKEQVKLRKLYLNHVNCNVSIASDLKNLEDVVRKAASNPLNEKTARVLEMAKSVRSNSKINGTTLAVNGEAPKLDNATSPEVNGQLRKSDGCNS